MRLGWRLYVVDQLDGGLREGYIGAAVIREGYYCLE